MVLVQSFLPADFPARIAICQWLLHILVHTPQLLVLILSTDEANFSRIAIRSLHNKHISTEENQHEIFEDRFQKQSSLNVWVGIVGNWQLHYLMTVFISRRLAGELYRNFLKQLFDAPSHFSVVAREFLTGTYGDC